jgi:hypothetical protein
MGKMPLPYMTATPHNKNIHHLIGVFMKKSRRATIEVIAYSSGYFVFALARLPARRLFRYSLDFLSNTFTISMPRHREARI